MRISAWLLLLTLTACLVYLNKIGLPEFIKQPLIEELRSHGLDLDFKRIRLRFHRGIVVEAVNIGQSTTTDGPQLFIDSAELKLNYAALRSLQLKIESLRMREGRLVWPLLAPGQPPELLEIDNIETDLRLLPGDQWQLDRFQASWLGTDFHLLGSLTNASGLRRTRSAATSQSPSQASQAAWQNIIRQSIAAVRQLNFGQNPQLSLEVNADALDISRSRAQLKFLVPQAQSPWGELRGFQLDSTFYQPERIPGVVEANLTLHADEVRAESLRIEAFQMDTQLQQSFTNRLPVFAHWHAEAARIKSRWGSGTNLELNGQARPVLDKPSWLTNKFAGHIDRFSSPDFSMDLATISVSAEHTLTNRIPGQARVEITMESPASRWGSAGSLWLAVDGRSASPSPTDASVRSWGFWTNIAPFRFSWEMNGSNLQTMDLTIPKFSLKGNWIQPLVSAHHFNVQFPEGSLQGELDLDVATRIAHARINTDFDLHILGPLLRPNSQRWLKQYSWKLPPTAQAQATATLPAWTNGDVDWRNEFLPTVALEGQLEINDAAFRTIPVTHAITHFGFSNLVWTLPDLQITRPEGMLILDYWNDTRNQDYRFRIQSHIDPQASHPMLNPAEIRVLKDFHFGVTPEITGTVWGRWKSPDRTAFDGHILATNLTFRGESTEIVSARVNYTNKVLRAEDINIQRFGQSADCPLVEYDGTSRLVILSNANCHLDPTVVTRVIGPSTTAAIRPYQFGQTPHVRVNGTIPIGSGTHPRLRFDVSGGPFSFFRFHLPEIQSQVLWQDDTLVLTNVQAGFYGGRLQGNAFFDFAPAAGADFHFLAQIVDAQLSSLIADVRTKTNRLEGILDGRLEVTRANTTNWQSWFGSGHARLQNGLIWDIPLFGIFSSVLNTIRPGIGNSRASDGTANFIITNSVIRTQDLDIRAPPVRLHYDGTVDFDGNVNARVEAILLRDTWLVGRVFSLALYPLSKIFEYRVTGTLTQPKTDPLYLLPRMLLMPLHPLRTVKEIFVPNEEKGAQPDSHSP
jgi:hypothetical protein